MFGRVNKRTRVKAAILLAALYAFCVLAPTAVLAVSSAVAAHCLTEMSATASPHHHGTKTHVHADGTRHQHHDDGANHSDDGQSQAATCCGLFVLNALPNDETLAVSEPPLASQAYAAPEDHLNGRGPDRIIRPPIA